jgi:hypothetical protein
MTGGVHRVKECQLREELDLDCAKSQAAEFSASQILSEGSFVSTVGWNEEIIGTYIRNSGDKQTSSWINCN